MTNDLLSRVTELPLFSGVASDALAGINDDMEANLFHGDYIVHQGDEPKFLYIILDGAVDIAAGPTTETRVFIDSRGSGDVIGEQAFIEKRDHSADVKARGAVKMLKIPATVALRLLADPSFSRNLLEAVSRKLRSATNQRYKALAERQLLFSHFKSHVNPQLVDQLLNHGEAYGHPRRIEQAFVMFSDLRSFTRLSSSMDVLDIAAELAPYFSALVDVVHATNGVVDKYIGDAVMAVWGHPALGSIMADDVMRACLEMVKRCANLTFGSEKIRLGIGLNAGPVFMGNIGTAEKRSFTVLGDAVNFAARYENANKAEDGSIYTITVGPAMFQLLSPDNQCMLRPRPDTKINGAPDDTQTVYSL